MPFTDYPNYFSVILFVFACQNMYIKVTEKEDPNLYIFRYTPLNLDQKIEIIQAKLARDGLSRKMIYNFKEVGKKTHVEYEQLMCGTMALQDMLEILQY